MCAINSLLANGGGVHIQTFGHRLRAAGVSFEDRQDLLGHTAGRITTHYSDAEITRLLEAVEKACDETPTKVPTLALVRRAGG